MLPTHTGSIHLKFFRDLLFFTVISNNRIPSHIFSTVHILISPADDGRHGILFLYGCNTYGHSNMKFFVTIRNKCLIYHFLQTTGNDYRIFFILNRENAQELFSTPNGR